MKKRIKAHWRRIRVSRDPEEHFRRPLYREVRVKKSLEI